MRTPLQWAIVETPTMAERASKIAQGRFQVFTDIAGAAVALGRIDLVHASSSIQYVAEPRDTLRALATLRARFLMLARLPVWGLAQVVGLQVSPLSVNGLGPMPPYIVDREVAYPVTFVNFDDVMKILADYEIAMAIDSPSSTYTIRGQKVPSITVIFRAKQTSPAV
jgi:putative methyltransferase (TIGR04325 family)